MQTTHSIKCDCQEWKNHIEKINGAISLGAIHGMPYTGTIFNFCPWCGKRLQPKQKYEIKEKPITEEVESWKSTSSGHSELT